MTSCGHTVQEVDWKTSVRVGVGVVGPSWEESVGLLVGCCSTEVLRKTIGDVCRVLTREREEECLGSAKKKEIKESKEDVKDEKRQ